jgi:hypothetical protein
MGVVDAESLRQNLREVGAKAMVVKNTLLRLALEEQGSPWDPDMMQGALLVTFASGDLGQATKAVVEFARTHERVFAIKGGMISGTIIDGDGVKALTELPSRECCWPRWWGRPGTSSRVSSARCRESCVVFDRAERTGGARGGLTQLGALRAHDCGITATAR